MDTGFAPAISNGPTTDAKNEYMREYRRQQRVVDEAKGMLRSILKRAKDDGLNTGSIRRACKAKRHDEADVIAELRDDLQYMAILQIGVSAEALFAGWTGEVSEPTREADDLWEAEDRGYTDGRHGRPLDDCPYPEGPLAEAYSGAWHKGQASIAKEMGGGEPLTPTRGAGRRRRAAEKAPEPLSLAGPPPTARRRGRPPKNAEARAQ